MPKVNYLQPCGASDITITFPSTSGTLQLAGGGGITGFTSQISTAAPNATVNVSQLLVAVSTTNGDVALEPKGTGAILAQIPTSTNAGGDKRGTYAVDFQRVRTTASNRVASSDYCIILGGNNNRASNTFAIVVGGQSNQATGSGSFIGGGDSNLASGSASIIAGGSGNQATAQFAVVSGGQQNFAQATHSTVSGGTQNYATATSSVVGGGSNNFASGLASTTSGGSQCFAQGNYAVVSGGQQNNSQATSTWAVIAGGFNNRIGDTSASSSSVISGGQTNTLNGLGSAIVGGLNHILTGSYSTILGGNLNYIVNNVQYATAVGYGASARDFGANSFANHYYTTVGDAQATDIVLSARTTNGTPATLGMSGSNVGVIIPDRTAATFSIFVTCRQTGTSNVGGWEITGLIENTAGTLTAYNVTNNLIHRSVGSWNATAVANSTTGRLDVQVTGSAASIQWVATARVTFSTFV